MEEKKSPYLANNWISALGVVIALFSGSIILFFLIIHMTGATTKPYVGILIYLVLPAFLVLGLLLIPAGKYFRCSAFKRRGEIPRCKWPSIDLNNKRHRNAALVSMLGIMMLLLISSVMIYQGYQYMDSVAFCVRTCHRVMAPEYATYQNSPHASIKCVGCHIGPGPLWYARSKLHGLYEVYSIIANEYPRPIPTPIKNLRPVQEDCHRCHWPNQSFGSQQHLINHYLYDKTNSLWGINMLINIGGSDPETAPISGIHWHTNATVTVEYIARDTQRQDIPWVRVTRKQGGRVTVYQDASSPLAKKEIEAAEPRIMDCIDCHNHPSHDFRSPDREIDLEISTGRIDPAIPEIKKVSVNAMAREYKSNAEALEGIAKVITDFYRTNYPEFLTKRGAAIYDAVHSTQAAFLRSIFPDMRARWSHYPNNIGHFIFRGCMRCHDGNHKDRNGSVIPNDCHTCHVIILAGQWQSFRCDKGKPP
jgi:hypothetical protein